MSSSNGTPRREPQDEGGRQMADKRIQPKVPKAEAKNTASVAAVGVSKTSAKKLHAKKLHAKKLHAKKLHAKKLHAKKLHAKKLHG
jgi:hypothetical protein